MEQLITQTPEDMALDGIIDLHDELELEDAEMDEAARQAVAEAKKNALQDLKEGAKSHAQQLQEHIRTAKEAAAKNRVAIRQEVKKRK
eukprot:3709255-Pyramimonas_sp.AAC.1